MVGVERTSIHKSGNKNVCENYRHIASKRGQPPERTISRGYQCGFRKGTILH